MHTLAVCTCIASYIYALRKYTQQFVYEMMENHKHCVVPIATGCLACWLDKMPNYLSSKVCSPALLAEILKCSNSRVIAKSGLMALWLNGLA